MLLGVPLVPLVFVGGIVALIASFLGLFWYLLLIPTVLIMSQVTRNDDQRWRLIGLYLRFRLRQRNAKLWQAAAYAPVRYRKRS